MLTSGDARTKPAMRSWSSEGRLLSNVMVATVELEFFFLKAASVDGDRTTVETRKGS